MVCLPVQCPVTVTSPVLAGRGGTPERFGNTIRYLPADPVAGEVCLGLPIGAYGLQFNVGPVRKTASANEAAANAEIAYIEGVLEPSEEPEFVLVDDPQGKQAARIGRLFALEL